MVIREVADADQLKTTMHNSISIFPFEIRQRLRPVVFTDEGTLLNGAVVHQSVNMAVASQIVPLVDSGSWPEIESCPKNTGFPWGGGLQPRQGVFR